MYAGCRRASPLLDPTLSFRVKKVDLTGPVQTPATKPVSLVGEHKVTIRPTEDYWRNFGSVRAPQVVAGGGGYSPEPHAEVNYVGLKFVPRLFKAGLSGWASPASPGWPPSASAGEYTTLRTAHIRPRTLPRNSTRATGTAAAFKGGVNRGRIPPVLVPRPRVAR
jgi:hypothetical protein